MADQPVLTSLAAVAPALRGPQRLLDRLFRSAALAFAGLVLLILSGVILSLVHGATPAFATFGLGFITSDLWNPVTDKFGAAVPIFGTLATSIIAMLFGVPLSLGVAIFITELCPPRLK